MPRDESFSPEWQSPSGESLSDAFAERFQELQDWEQHSILASMLRLADLMDAGSLDASPMLTTEALDAAEVGPHLDPPVDPAANGDLR